MHVNTPLVELIDAGIEFPGVRVSGISFNVTRGEFVCLYGPTGSGKTLALNMIAGRMRPHTGRVMVAGDCINTFSDRQMMLVRRTMGIMRQELLLLNDRTVLENVMLPALAAEESYGEAHRRAMRALENCGIADLASLSPQGLSAGQKQIACLARAIVNQPAVVLADEPCAHLDLENAQLLMDLLGNVSLWGTSVIVASHLEIRPNTVAVRAIELAGPRTVEAHEFDGSGDPWSMQGGV